MENQMLLFMARKMKGYMMKKSSQLLVGWQRRYWMIVDAQLVYYADEAMGQQKGSFQIADMTEIHAESTKELRFSYQGRQYELKAEDPSARNEWVRCLKMLNENLKSKEEYKPLITARKSNVDSQKRKSLEQQRRSSGKMNKVTIGKPIQSEKQLSDQGLLIAVGLDRLAKSIDNQKFSSRILFGLFKQGYFFSVSCKSLSQSYDDDEILSVEYIHPFDFNTIYKVRLGQNIVKEVTKANFINQMVMKSDHQIVVNYGAILSLVSKGDLNRFFQRLEKVVLFGREYHNEKGIELKRNIDSLVKKYDECKGLIERREKVKIAFESYFVKLSNKNQFKPLTNYQNLNTFVTILTSDLNQFIDACSVKPIPRVDLIQEYANFIHGKIYSSLHAYWNQTHNTIETKEILQLAQLSSNYSEVITKYVKDNRMINGPGILATVYYRKILNQINTEIQKIIHKVSMSTLEIKEDVLTHKYPTEYCNMASKYMKSILSYANVAPILTESCNFIHSSFQLWSSKIIQVIQKCTDTNHIISFCNDSETYNTLIFGVFQNIMVSKGLPSATYLKHMQNCKITNTIVDLHNHSIRRLFTVLFSTINQKLLTPKFMEIDIDGLTKEVLNRLDTLHNVRETTYHDIEFQAVQEVMSYYINTLGRLLPSSKISNDTLIKKINFDRSRLEQLFKSTLKTDELAKMLDQLIVVIEFLNADSVVTVRKHCLSFVGLPRNTFNLKFAKSLIELKFTKGRDQQSEFYRICEDVFTQIPEQRTRSEYQNQMFEPVSKQSYMENWDSSARRSTITMSLADKHLLQIAAEAPHHHGLPQGYLQIKKVSSGKSKTFYQQKYFKLQQKQIQYYVNKQSKQRCSSIPIFDIKKIEIQKPKTNTFILELSDIQYKFMAENSKECYYWVDSIKNAIEQMGNIEAKTFVVTQKNDLFVDFFANTKSTLKQSSDIQNGNIPLHRESVLSTLSVPKSLPKKPEPPKPNFDNKSSSKVSETSSPNPSPKKPIQPRLQAQHPRGCWFGFTNCMKL